jgi:hypothetical protein
MRKYSPNVLRDREELATLLVKMFGETNFIKKPNTRGEDVYEFEILQVPGARIAVFSSIVGNAVRGDGEDAIRVGVIYRRKDGADKSILSETRVNRTGAIDDIVERTKSRMRAAYVDFRERQVAGLRCARCNAPLFTSRQGNNVCAETCWVKELE